MDGWNDMTAYLYNEADLKPHAMHFWNYDREKNMYTNFQVDLNLHTQFCVVFVYPNVLCELACYCVTNVQ